MFNNNNSPELTSDKRDIRDMVEQTPVDGDMSEV